jgi:hypothetical protein
MKKIVFIAIIFMSMNLSAQFTIKAGLLKSKIIVKDITVSNINKSNIDPLFGGLYYQFTPLDLLGIEAGLQYTGIIEDADGINIDIKNHYLSLPLSVSLRPKSFISPGVGIMLSSLVDSNVPDILEQKTLDASGFVKITLNPINKIGIELGYNHGFVPFLNWENTNAGGVSINNSSVQNRFYYLALALRI